MTLRSVIKIKKRRLNSAPREKVIFLTLCNPLGMNKMVVFFETIINSKCEFESPTSGIPIVIGGGNRIRTGVKRFCRPLP